MKGKKAYKDQFGGMQSIDILVNILLNGEIKISGYTYILTDIREGYGKAENYAYENWVKSEKSFFEKICKLDDVNNEIYAELNERKKSGSLITNDELPFVLLSLLSKSSAIIFNMKSEKINKEVLLYIDAVDVYHFLVNCASELVKKDFELVLADDNYKEYVPFINNYKLLKLYRMTGGEFIKKSYAKDFIKTFMSLAGASKSGFGVFSLSSMSMRWFYENMIFSTGILFDYEKKDDSESFFFQLVNDDLFSINFSENGIKLLSYQDLSKLAIAVLNDKSQKGVNYIVEKSNEWLC